MKPIKLTAEGKEFEAGFNNSFAKLEGREDLAQFLIAAHRSGRKDYLAKFDNPPSLEELLAAQADQALSTNQVFTSQPLHLPSNQEQKSMGPATPQGAPGLAGSTQTTNTPEETPAAATAPAVATTGGNTGGVTQVTGLVNRTATQGGTGAAEGDGK